MTDATVKRTTLVVSDALASIGFYRDVLGMKEYYNQEMTVGGKIIPAGIPGAAIRLGIMEGPDTDIGKIGLLQWTDPPLPARNPAQRLGIGDLVFVTETDDMEDLHRRLAASPLCRVHCPPHEWQVPLPDGRGSKPVVTLSFFDPDGFFFEVNHKPTDPQPQGFVVRRTTQIVAAIEPSLRFYRDALGLRVWYDQEMTIDGNLLPAGEPGAQVRVVILQGDSSATGMVGLLEFLDPRLASPAQPRTELGIGDAILVASAQDQPLAVINERLQDTAVRVHAEPAADEVTGADGSVIKLTTMSMFDPGGFFMELNERRVIKTELRNG